MRTLKEIWICGHCGAEITIDPKIPMHKRPLTKRCVCGAYKWKFKKEVR